MLTETWETKLYATCRDCNMYYVDDDGQAQCQVIEGRESWHEAPCVQEHIAWHEIRLYGENKPPEKRSSLRFRR